MIDYDSETVHSTEQKLVLLEFDKKKKENVRCMTRI